MISFMSLRQLVAALPNPPNAVKAESKRGFCSNEPSMTDLSGFEEFDNDFDLRNAKYVHKIAMLPMMIPRKDALLSYVIGPTPNTAKGFAVGVVAATPGTGKTRLIDVLRRAYLPNQNELVRIAITFNGWTSVQLDALGVVYAY
jgi:hypothetical protein